MATDYATLLRDHVTIQYRSIDHQIPVVKFKKGQVKEEIARPYPDAAARARKDRPS
jgi:hypothetical protein